MRCRAPFREVLQPCAFLGWGSVVLALVAVASWLGQQWAATTGVGLVLAIWLATFTRIIRRPINATSTGERRLRFTSLVGAFDAPVHELRLVKATHEKDGWQT